MSTETLTIGSGRLPPAPMFTITAPRHASKMIKIITTTISSINNVIEPVKGDPPPLLDLPLPAMINLKFTMQGAY